MQNGKINDIHFLHPCHPPSASCLPSHLMLLSLQENYDPKTIDFYASWHCLLPLPPAPAPTIAFCSHCNKIFALSYQPLPRPLRPSNSHWKAITILGCSDSSWGFSFLVLGVVAAAAAASFVCCLAILYALLAKLPFAGPLHSLFRYVVYIVTVAAFFALQLAFTVGFYVCILCVWLPPSSLTVRALNAIFIPSSTARNPFAAFA